MDIDSIIAWTIKTGGKDPILLVAQARQEFRGASLEECALGVETALAHARYPELPPGWLVRRDLLEQASKPATARHHASRLSGGRALIEIGSGAGLDTFAFSTSVDSVTSFDLSSEASSLLALNASRAGITNIAARNEDALAIDLSGFDCFWADPARRNSSGRTFNPEEYSPPLSTLLAHPLPPIGGIKVSPGLNLESLPRGWTKEWIGTHDSCVEQVLWKGVELHDNTVTLVASGDSWFPPEEQEFDCGIATPRKGDLLLEPHPALIRTGGLNPFYQERGFCLLDPTIAYGCTEHAERSPWYDRFEIKDVALFSWRVAQEIVIRHRLGAQTEIKKRGFSETSDQLKARLQFEGDQPGILFFTRSRGERLIVLAERL